MKNWKRWLKILALVLVIVVAVGVWAFFHWAGFMLRSPLASDIQYDWDAKSIAGTSSAGFQDGAMPRFNKPIRFAPFGDKTVLVADINNHAIRVVQLNGETKTIAGGPDKQGHRDGPSSEAQFDAPHGVAVRADGVIAVADASNHVIRLMTPVEDGADLEYSVSTWAGVPGRKGFQDGLGNQSLFNAPHAVAWGPEQELYVADIGNSRLRVIQDGTVSTLAGTGAFGEANGKLGVSTFQYPIDLCVDDQGDVLIADGGTGLIRKYDTESGTLSTPWGDIRIDMPHGLAAAPDGQVVIAEMYGHRVVMLNSGKEIIRLVGNEEPGAAINQLTKPAAVLVHDGYLWIADLGNHRIVVAEWPDHSTDLNQPKQPAGPSIEPSNGLSSEKLELDGEKE